MQSTCATRTRRPTQKTEAVSRTVLSVVRILIASYFLAMATGLIFEPASRTFLDAVLPAEQAQFASTTYLFLTAFWIMVGRAVRPAALLLAVYIFWSGFLHYDISSNSLELSAYWRDMALMGAVLLIAVTEPGGRTRMSVRKKQVAPRRIRQDAVINSARPPRDEAQKARDAILAGFVPALATATGSSPNDLTDDEDDPVENLFADIWDTVVPAGPGCVTA